MIAANIPDKVKPIVGQKVFETATKLDQLVPITIDGVTKTRAEHCTGKLPGFVHHLRTWGEAGTVKIKNFGTPKMGDRGLTCMFVGYASDHSGDCYEMLNLNTRRILQTRDVIWLGKMYYSKMKTEFQVSIDEEDIDENEKSQGISDFDEKSQGNSDENNKSQGISDENNKSQGIFGNNVDNLDDAIAEVGGPTDLGVTTKSGRRICAPQWWINEPSNITVDEILAAGAGIGGGFVHTSELLPMKYQEAMNKDPEEWSAAVDKEHERMDKHKVFKAVNKKDVPADAKVLTLTWAMKLKADGTKRACLNAQGYEQVPGEHYDENGI